MISKDKYFLQQNKMEIVEIISYHQSENITEVTFRLMNDEEDMVRTDVIENNFFEEFGYETLQFVQTRQKTSHLSESKHHFHQPFR